jgi:prepilin-type N-terminal cleavage/methylation domain-containing protein
MTAGLLSGLSCDENGMAFSRPADKTQQHETKGAQMNTKQGFTLVEIMIVVAIIGLLAAIAIPSFVKARSDSQQKACINNLRIMDSAKEQAAMEQKWSSGRNLNAADVTNALAYVKGSATPSCPGGGSYTWNNIGVPPTCTVTASHRLP